MDLWDQGIKIVLLASISAGSLSAASINEDDKEGTSVHNVQLDNIDRFEVTENGILKGFDNNNVNILSYPLPVVHFNLPHLHSQRNEEISDNFLEKK